MTPPRPARTEVFDRFEINGLLTDRRAMLSCGCSIFVGERGDMIDTLGNACMVPHRRIVDRALVLLADRQPPDEDELLAVVAAALGEASHELRPPITEEA